MNIKMIIKNALMPIAMYTIYMPLVMQLYMANVTMPYNQFAVRR